MTELKNADRMGRLHRIGQKKDVYIYHLVAPETREGRVQEVMLGNLEAAAESLGGRIFDLLDATVARGSPGFDFARALVTAQAEPNADIAIPDVATLKRACEALANEDKHLRTREDASSGYGAGHLRPDNAPEKTATQDSGGGGAKWIAHGFIQPARWLRETDCRYRAINSPGHLI